MNNETEELDRWADDGGAINEDTLRESADPLSYQVGGDHYKKYEYQPIQLFADLDLGVIPANIVKYLARWRYKNGLEDLKKARHYALFWYELGKKTSTLKKLLIALKFPKETFLLMMRKILTRKIEKRVFFNQDKNYMLG